MHFRASHFAVALASILVLAAAAVALGYHPDPVATGGFGGLVGAMALQTAYSERITAGVPGMIADQQNADVDTYVCETSAGVAFGKAVCQGTADKGATLGGSAAADFLGVSVRDITLIASSATYLDKYEQYQNMGVLSKGDIWVTADGAVNAGDNVTFETTTGNLGTKGADETHLAVTGGRWMTTAADGGVAILRLSGVAHSG